VAVTSASAWAAAGQLDKSFSGDGKRLLTFTANPSDTGEGVAVQANGRIVIVGGTDVGGSAGNEFTIARLRPGGSLDHTFSGDGKRLLSFGPGRDDSGFAVAIQADGRIVVVGLSENSSAVSDFAVARLKSNGNLDHSFSGDGKRFVGFGDASDDDRAFALALQGDGRIVLAGAANLGGASGTDFAIARLRPNGSLDPSFSDDGERVQSFGNGSATDQAFDVAVRGGRIVVVGTTLQGTTSFDFGIVALKPDGTLDPTFSSDGKRLQSFGAGAVQDQGTAVGIRPDGRIVVAGDTDADPGPFVRPDFAVARYRVDGTLDPSFSGDGRREIAFGSNSDFARALALQRDGATVVAGGAVLTSPDSAFAVARLTPAGKLDNSFSGDGKRLQSFEAGSGAEAANDVAIQRNGAILAVGNSAQGPPSGTDIAIARFLGG
jgi:uncharacterized delta-60 repeat protein